MVGIDWLLGMVKEYTGKVWLGTTGTIVELGTGTLAEPQLNPTLWMAKLQVCFGALGGRPTVTLLAPPH